MFDKWRDYVKQLKRETYALYLAYQHPDTPLIAKIWTIIVVAYALSPIDLIPDFIPVLGYLDDLIFVPLGIVLAIKLIPPDVMAECREQAAQIDTENKLGRYAAAMIVTLWIIVGVVIVVWLANVFLFSRQ